ncbi:MAG: hypothetical protein WBE86_12165 [Candidatus Acidiferrales bacterium]
MSTRPQQTVERRIGLVSWDVTGEGHETSNDRAISTNQPQGAALSKSSGQILQFRIMRKIRQGLGLLVAISAAGLLASSVSAQEPASSVTKAKKQGPGDQLPLYARPTFAKRLQTYASSTLGPIKMGRVVFGAAISQADNVPPEWGQGWSAYGKRFTSHFAVDFIDGGTNLVLSEALRDDTLYYPCVCKGIWPRTKHALFSSVTARRGADGHRVFSIPAVASPYAGSFTSLAWYPARYGPKDAFRTGNYDLVNSVAAKVALEFLNPLLRKLHL